MSSRDARSIVNRDAILRKLRSAPRPFIDVRPAETYLPVVPPSDADLVAQFVTQAQRLAAEVHRCADQEDALGVIATLLGDDKSVLTSDFNTIPLPILPAMLDGAGIKRAAPRDESVWVGITGVDAALAATGSLVLRSGIGLPRLPSLLPPIHIAVLTADQIVPSFEAWIADKRAAGLAQFRETASIILISGPSRTADIAMQLTMGMHGPEQLHIIIPG